MSDHHGIRCLFHQPNINSMQALWLDTLSELEFEINYIKRKDNWVANALSRRVQVNYLHSSFHSNLFLFPYKDVIG